MENQNSNLAVAGKSFADSLNFVGTYGGAVTTAIAIATDYLTPFLGKANSYIAFFLIGLLLVLFAIYAITHFQHKPQLEQRMMRLTRGRWFFPVFGMLVLSAGIFLGAAVAGMDTENGALAENFEAIADLQKMMGMVAADVKDIKKDTEQLKAGQGKLQVTADETLQLVRELKDKKIWNVEKKIVDMQMSLDDCIKSGYLEGVNLYLKDGSDPNVLNFSRPLVTAVAEKRENYDKILFLAMEYGLDVKKKIFTKYEYILALSAALDKSLDRAQWSMDEKIKLSYLDILVAGKDEKILDELKKLNVDFSDTKMIIDILSKFIDNEIEGKMKEIEGEKSRIIDKEDSIEEYNERIEKNEIFTANKRKEIEEYRKNGSQLYLSLIPITEEVIKKLEKDLKDYKKRVADFEQEIENYKGNITRMEQEIRDLEASRASYEQLYKKYTQ